MREVTVGLLLASLVLFTSTPAQANLALFAIYQGDMDGNGTPDIFFTEIEVQVTGATQVQLDTGSGWEDFENEGGGEFYLETSDYATLAALLADISGPKTLKITTPAGDSNYTFTVTGSEAAVNTEMPTPIPQITGLAWAGNTATLSWAWAGDANAVDGIAVEVETQDGNTWDDVYFKSNIDPPPNYMPKTALEANDIVLPAAPGTYDEIEFYVAYGNATDVSDGNGTIIDGWTLTDGNDLFGDPGDLVLQGALSADVLEIPEPATLTLLGLGAAALVRRRRRRADR